MSLFHKHKFQLKDNVLWCECGKTKELPCNHQWDKHARSEILTIRGMKQILDIFICKKCGKIISVNLTTGIKE